ncbi:AgmX/PglI C-terminal domain-containing protein [Corallococcus macrosporus]|uniref:FHA domain-containing protein n=1 Tax=Myxococcus fulvus (strain ATCC BAA-855 / HW-1) TaxID=483219 RepID=F8CE00_MYXFH|nr:AgmX/PglI C-terminal domain-containing protein [Corallococcus macrosporus]AEI62359.1 FHA domain-containing protein [Corallococcus macrosporus]
MSGQPSVLQVVILRDGLLVGTEVFVPGTYALGSDPASDLRLDDPSVEPRHALLYFQNGRAAVQDAGSAGGLFVNGHRVSACEIRPVDEVLCGPFILKTRVLSQKPQEAKPQPPPEVAALLGAAQAPSPFVAPPPQAAVPPPSAAPAHQLRPATAVPPNSATLPAARVPVAPPVQHVATQVAYPTPAQPVPAVAMVPPVAQAPQAHAQAGGYAQAPQVPGHAQAPQAHGYVGGHAQAPQVPGHAGGHAQAPQAHAHTGGHAQPHQAHAQAGGLAHAAAQPPQAHAGGHAHVVAQVPQAQVHAGGHAHVVAQVPQAQVHAGGHAHVVAQVPQAQVHAGGHAHVVAQVPQAQVHAGGHAHVVAQVPQAQVHAGGHAHVVAQAQPTAIPASPGAPRPAQQAPTGVPASTVPSARRRAAPEPAPSANTGMRLADELMADLAIDPLPEPTGPLLEEQRTLTRPTHAPRIATGKGAAQLYLDLYWGAIRRDARRFAPDKKKPVQASLDLEGAMPLWGFTLPDGAPFTLAESVNNAFRLFVPPGTDVEKSGNDGRFTPVTGAALESDGSRRFLTLREGTAARLTQGQMSLVAYAAPKPARVFVNPLKGLPWLTLTFLGLFASALGAFLVMKPHRPEVADFQQKSLPPVALRLIAPEPKKKEEAKKKLEAIKAQAKKPTKEKVAEKAPPKPVEKTPPPKQPERAVAAAAPQNKALKALAKLSAAGPATNNLLAAVDKLGSGPGSKNVKNSNYKLSGLIGKAPIANAGLGTFGLGGGGKGGGATLGKELLRGKGGGGIGALGAGGVGKGKVGGTVTRATARSIASTQGTVDREAVARVINSHLNEVHGCYERGLLKDPGLAGKVVLEWTIGASGRVVAAKTKSSTLRNASVESCILSRLKSWKFPAPKGGVVIITYPFLFNSVGY